MSVTIRSISGVVALAASLAMAAPGLAQPADERAAALERARAEAMARLAQQQGSGSEEQAASFDLTPSSPLGQAIAQLDLKRSAADVMVARAELARLGELVLEPIPEAPAPDTAPSAEEPDTAEREEPEGGEGGDDEAAKAAAEAAAAIAAAKAKNVQTLAKRFHLLVRAGAWEELGRFLREHGGEDAEAIYRFTLKGLATDTTSLPDDVIALSDIAMEMEKGHVEALARLLRSSLRRGEMPASLLGRLEAGTVWLGGDDHTKRLNAARLLLDAGLEEAAGGFVPPMAGGTDTMDPDELVLRARIVSGQAERASGAERRGLAMRCWSLAQQVLYRADAGKTARHEALDLAFGVADMLHPPVVDRWLDGVFESDSNLGWYVVRSAWQRANNTRTSFKQPGDRLEALRALGRVVRAVVAAGDDRERWGAATDLATLAILTECRDTRAKTRRDNFVFIPPEDLAAELPDHAWIAALDPGLAEAMCACQVVVLGQADELERGVDLVGFVAETDGDRAAELAVLLLDGWASGVRGGGAPQRHQQRYYGGMPYGGYYGGYYGGAPTGAIPLTRMAQARNLERLEMALIDLAGMDAATADPAQLARVFQACHSDAEVYAPEDVARVFGPIEHLGRDRAMAVAGTMRTNLGSVWRNARVQQSKQTNRTDQQLVAQVVAGYELALRIAERAEAGEASWESAQLLANLRYDLAEFLYGQEVELERYAELREGAFALHAEASDRYAASLRAGEADPTALGYMRWFQAALGASDLGYLTRQDQPDDDQIDRIAAAIGELGDRSDEHVGLFAGLVNTGAASVNAELRHRFVRHAMRIIGDHPEGEPVRELLAYYEDLLREVMLTIEIDGSSDVGTDEPFGVHVSIDSTAATARESGGFSKYLRNGWWNRFTGQQVDYRDDFERAIRETLVESFEVESITFHEGSETPALTARRGWVRTPMAYIVLRAEDPAIDRVPPLKIDLDFSDGSGAVILPVESNPTLINARGEAAESPGLADLVIEQTLDEREHPGGPLRLEILARAEGLLPQLDRLVDPAVDGFEVVSTMDNGVNVLELAFEGGRPVARTERSWLLELRPEAAAARSDRFVFPAALAADADMTRMRFADADIVETGSEITLASAGLGVRPAWWIGGGLIALLAVALGGWWWRRSRGAAGEEIEPAYVEPASLTPVSAIALLRRIERDGTIHLSQGERSELRAEVEAMEQRYFAPDSGSAGETRLAEPVRRWVSVACRSANGSPA